MRTVIQRASEASVVIDGEVTGKIGLGLVVLLGIETDDTEADLDWLCPKIANLRIFNDEEGIMNKSLLEIDGNILIISQFTLHASTKKGNRPFYIKAARPEFAIFLYEKFIAKMEMKTGKHAQTGRFGAMMQVSLVNDGPVTIIIDSKQRE
jgi:D-tyrosyl-tRNA(Tyr) deacylase